jgi:glutathione S-transferase
MKVYGDTNSGNCLKVKWVCDHLALPYTWIAVDTLKGETRTAEFLKLNGAGQVPTVELDDGRTLAQSNAIIRYLARGSHLIPQDAFAEGKMDEWLFWEQYSHEPYIAVARFICGWTPIDSPRRADLPRLRERSHQALAVMERHLSAHAWFTGDEYGIADIALFAYTCVAGHGGVSLENYPAIRDWLARIAQTPGFMPMPEPDAAAAALIAQSN